MHRALTTYILDTATPLTMVLAETNTGTGVTTRYWHGLDTLAQSDGTTTQYFAYDGLGSVRQLVGESGSVGLAQTFDPYGNGFSKTGSASSSFGYSGEQVDANGFVYLRARYYAPGMGRFTQMDPSRQEKNVYLYSAGNPILFVDPSGLIKDPASDLGECYTCAGAMPPFVKEHIPKEQEADAALRLIKRLTEYGIKIKIDFGWRISGDYGSAFVSYDNGMRRYLVGSCHPWEEGNWREYHELELVMEGVEKIADTFATVKNVPLADGKRLFRAAMPWSIIVRVPTLYNPNAGATTLFYRVNIPNVMYGNDEYARGAVIHEFGHVWDFHSGFQLTARLETLVKEYECGPSPDCRRKVYRPGELPPGDSDTLPVFEDWANSFHAFIEPLHSSWNGKTKAGKTKRGNSPSRQQFVHDAIASLRY